MYIEFRKIQNQVQEQMQVIDGEVERDDAMGGDRECPPINIAADDVDLSSTLQHIKASDKTD